jgi:hypothetical protein
MLFHLPEGFEWPGRNVGRPQWTPLDSLALNDSCRIGDRKGRPYEERDLSYPIRGLLPTPGP